MTIVACETALTVFVEPEEALERARLALASLGFEVSPGHAALSLLARRPSFRKAPASGVTISARETREGQTTLSVRAWGKTPREACELLAQRLGARKGGKRALQAPGPEDLRGEEGYSLADAPARARRELFGGEFGQLVYSSAAGCIAALIVIFVFFAT